MTAMTPDIARVYFDTSKFQSHAAVVNDIMKAFGYVHGLDASDDNGPFSEFDMKGNENSAGIRVFQFRHKIRSVQGVWAVGAAGVFIIFPQ